MNFLHRILFVAGLLLLAFLAWRMDLVEVGRQMKGLGLGMIVIIAAEGISEFCHTISWRFCLSQSHRHIPLLRLFRITLAGYAINFATPTASIGGEVAKGALLIDESKGPEAITGILIGKLSFALSHLCFVLFGLGFIFSRIHLPFYLWSIVALSTGLMTLGITAFLLLQKHGKLGAFIHWISKLNLFSNALRRLSVSIARIDDALKQFYRERPKDLVYSVIWHLVGYSVGILTTWYFLGLLSGEAKFSAAAQIWFLALWFDLMTFAFPFGLGVLEGSRIASFRTFQFEAVTGLTFALVTRVAQIFWALIGLISYGLMIRRSQSRRSSQSDWNNSQTYLPSI